MPGYFVGDCTVHSCEMYAVACFCCEKDNLSYSMTQRAVMKLSIYYLTC